MIIGVGIDIESVSSFRRMRPDVFARVVARVLTEEEVLLQLAGSLPARHSSLLREGGVR